VVGAWVLVGGAVVEVVGAEEVAGVLPPHAGAAETISASRDINAMINKIAERFFTLFLLEICWFSFN
jgi:hypothetical protein